MTVITTTHTTTHTTAHAIDIADALRPVAVDLYRDIHKGIRVELFELTADAGRLDPADDCGATALAAHVRAVVGFLVQHAEHEDGAIQPVLEVHLPTLAASIARDHEVLDERMARLVGLADATRSMAGADRRGALHELYVELACFTGAYLLHQDMEERIVGPALEAAIGVDAVLGIHQQIVTSIPPQALGEALAVMLPAMNVDDRTELLGGMKAGAPAEAFSALWSIAGSVLTAEDHRAVAARLDDGPAD